MSSRRTGCDTLPLLLAAALMLAFSSLPLSAADSMKAPPNRQAASTHRETPSTGLAWLGDGAIRFYARYISPADGPRSPSYPTGSAYGRNAIRSYGFFIGTLLIADRLIHEADRHQGPRMVRYGVSRYYDPVRYNTYWWDHPD